MKAEIVFFDAGETLLRPYPSFPQLLTQICGENGYPISAEDAAEVQQRLAPHLVELAEETGIDKPSLDPEHSRIFWTHLYRRITGELGIEDEALVETLFARFSHPSSYRLFDDALPCLTSLQNAGFRLGLISNFEGWLQEMLTEMEVGHLFEVSVISGFEGMEKPDRGLYDLALERAGVDGRDAVHIGDSPKMDVEPAREVGMTGVLLDRYNRYPDAEGPRVSSLSDIPSLLEKLTGPES